MQLEPPERTREAASTCLEESIASHLEELGRLADTLDGGETQGAGEAPVLAATSGGRGGFDALVERMSKDSEVLLDNYFKLEDPAFVVALATERWVRVLLPSRPTEGNGRAAERVAGRTELIGVIDRLDQTASGEVVVTDYKTGRAPQKNYERDAFFGLRFYSAILSELGHSEEVPRRLRLLYLQDAQVLEDEVTQLGISSTLQLIGAIAEAIERAHRNDDWRPNPGPLCNHCHFKPICPAHN